MERPHSTRRALIAAGAALSAVPTVSTASTDEARFLAWEREATFWREASNDASPKTDAELDVILDRARHFEDLIMTTPGHGVTVARIRARIAPRDVRDFGPAHLEAPLVAVLAALDGPAV
jgi:hypothetical protein